MAEPAYRRLQVDERRRRLLDRATELFARHGYDELSMARIGREAVDVWLDWIDTHRDAYLALQRSAGIPEVKELIERVREETASACSPRSASRSRRPCAPPVRAWLWYMDGVCLDWVHEGDLDHDAVRGLLLGTLLGALTAAGLDPAALGELVR
ncbi:MAG: hypothetical protein QOK21_2673 [Solirubrobacteraceae bacterium]|nr:hypothetical protein [Solirubrobacteraceae bacterium]